MFDMEENACEDFEHATWFFTYEEIVSLYWKYVDDEKRRGNETEGASIFKEGLLKSTIERARYGDVVEPDIFESAAFLIEGIAQYHTFGNLNKRFSLVSAKYFMIKNGWNFSVDVCDLVNFMIEVAEGFKNRCDIKQMLVEKSSRIV